MALGTLANSGWGLALTWSATKTLPESSPWRQIDLIDSHCQQPPATSPASAASLISAVPLYPATSWIGNLRAAINSFAVLYVVSPGATPPSFTGVLAFLEASKRVMPLALAKAQATLSWVGMPMYSNLRASNSMPGLPMIWLITWLP